jgi:hypothetical protein
MMCTVGDNPASCKILAKNMSAAEIHLELCAIYGQYVMSEGTVRQWHRIFKDGQQMNKCS